MLELPSRLAVPEILKSIYYIDVTFTLNYLSHLEIHVEQSEKAAPG
jgi:hypothetical protein